jgi:hypothetical protein
MEVRELKLAVGDQYFEPALLVAFTRFNFRARRAFFKAMHLDLHAIREAVNELEQKGYTSIDCREAGLTENESLAQVRHVVHQWKTPFRAPYSGGSSFLQLILLRHILQATLNHARAASAAHVNAVEDPGRSVQPQPASVLPSSKVAIPPELKVAPAQEPLPEAFSHVEPSPATQVSARPNKSADPLLMMVGEAPVPLSSEPKPSTNAALAEEDDYLARCVADITEQLSAMPPKNSPTVSAITLAGCKLLIATWEAQAFIDSDNEMARALQRTVAARTILHVCMERHRKGEPADVTVALDLARQQVHEMEAQVSAAKEASNIDAAVNLAATTKRLLSLIDEAEKLSA